MGGLLRGGLLPRVREGVGLGFEDRGVWWHGLFVRLCIIMNSFFPNSDLFFLEFLGFLAGCVSHVRRDLGKLTNGGKWVCE